MRIRKSKEGLDPVRHANDTEVAWAAGFYEGEGSCINTGKGRRSFGVSVAQKDPEVLYRLRDLFGGRVAEFLNNRGTIASKSKPFTIFIWRVCGDRSRIFLTAIYPYLSGRRKAQIDSTAAIDFREFCGELPRTEIIPFIHSKLALWIQTHRNEARERIRENYQRYYDKNRNNVDHVAHRREVRRLWRERKKLALTSKEGN